MQMNNSMSKFHSKQPFLFSWVVWLFFSQDQATTSVDGSWLSAVSPFHQVQRGDSDPSLGLQWSHMGHLGKLWRVCLPSVTHSSFSSSTLCRLLSKLILFWCYVLLHTAISAITELSECCEKQTHGTCTMTLKAVLFFLQMERLLCLAPGLGRLQSRWEDELRVQTSVGIKGGHLVEVWLVVF